MMVGTFDMAIYIAEWVFCDSYTLEVVNHHLITQYIGIASA